LAMESQTTVDDADLEFIQLEIINSAEWQHDMNLFIDCSTQLVNKLFSLGMFCNVVVRQKR
jgi:hypothetical protein